MINTDSKIFLAGHNGMVGSALYRFLKNKQYKNLIIKSSKELDLTDQQAVKSFFNLHKIDCIILAAAKVGGIYANNTFKADFIYQNLAIQNNVIHQGYLAGVKKLLFLGSSCIYPKECPQPMKEEYLLSGYLEKTNEPYAIAKICGIKMCEAYNFQYNTDYRAVMPTNLYGPYDNFDLEKSHVLPAMIRKFHLSKLAQKDQWELIKKDEKNFGEIPKDFLEHLKKMCQDRHKHNNDNTDNTDNMDNMKNMENIYNINNHYKNNVSPSLILWGSGSPSREFLHVDDLSSACYNIMKLSKEDYSSICKNEPFINIGCGEDLTIKELANLIKKIIGFSGNLKWDTTKPDGTKKKLLNVDRLKVIGWSPSTSLKEGIERTYEWYNSV